MIKSLKEYIQKKENLKSNPINIRDYIDGSSAIKFNENTTWKKEK